MPPGTGGGPTTQLGIQGFPPPPTREAPDSSSCLDSWCFPHVPASEPLSGLRPVPALPPVIYQVPVMRLALAGPYLSELSGKAATVTGAVSGCPEELLSRRLCRGATEPRSEGELELLQGRRKGREREVWAGPGEWEEVWHTQGARERGPGSGPSVSSQARPAGCPPTTCPIQTARPSLWAPGPSLSRGVCAAVHRCDPQPHPQRPGHGGGAPNVP